MDETSTAYTPWPSGHVKTVITSEHVHDHSELCLDSLNGIVTIDIEQAVEQWGDTVLRLALCRLGNRFDAEDVVQTVFMKLCECERPPQCDAHLKAWLLRVTLNCCTDLYRAPWNKRRASSAESEAVFERTSSQPESVYTLEGPFGGGITSVQEAITALPNHQRIVLHLHYYEGYATAEIAQMMDQNPSTVRSHLRRARISLKTMIGGIDE